MRPSIRRLSEKSRTKPSEHPIVIDDHLDDREIDREKRAALAPSLGLAANADDPVDAPADHWLRRCREAARRRPGSEGAGSFRRPLRAGARTS